MGARHAWPELDPSEQFENRPDKSGRQPAFMQPRPARRESDLGGVALKPQQLVAELLELFPLRLDGAAHRVETFGAGTFDHNEPGKAVISAKWTSGMVFDDAAGTLDGRGDVVAISTPDPLSRDEIEAKARDLMRPIIGAQRAEQLVATVRGLEALRSVRELTPLLQA